MDHDCEVNLMTVDVNNNQAEKDKKSSLQNWHNAHVKIFKMHQTNVFLTLAIFSRRIGGSEFWCVPIKRTWKVAEFNS